MTKKNSSGNYIERVKKVTSIGCSSKSRPKNKHKRRNWKKYRGQGTR